MRKTGLRFYIEGEYCQNLLHLPDPNNENWVSFRNEDINPFKNSHFTIWSDFENPLSYPFERDGMVKEIVAVINWLRDELSWEGFCATLWLRHDGENKDEIVKRWDLC